MSAVTIFALGSIDRFARWRLVPQPFRPYRAELEAYTFAVVLAVLKKIRRPPAALKGIPDPFYSRLLATLVNELANVTTMVLQRGWRSEHSFSLDYELLLKHGGTVYRRLRRESIVVQERLLKLFNEERQHERTAIGYCDEGRERLPNTRFGLGAFGKVVRWRYDLPMNKGIDAVRQRFRSIARKKRQLEVRRKRIDARLAKYEARIRTLSVFRADQENFSWQQLKVDFDSVDRWSSEGAAFYLKNNNHRWWALFMQWFSHIVIRDARRAPHRIALRDPNIVAAIDARASHQVGWDEAASEYFTQHPDNEWGVQKPMPNAVGAMRRRLVRDDRRAMLWLEAHGYRSNDYCFYFHRLERRYHEEPERHVARRWLQNLTKRFPFVGLENIEWRLNELSWCLSRPPFDTVAFKPLTSLQHGASEWEAHRRRWWRRVQDAMLRLPNNPPAPEK